MILFRSTPLLQSDYRTGYHFHPSQVGKMRIYVSDYTSFECCLYVSGIHSVLQTSTMYDLRDGEVLWSGNTRKYQVSLIISVALNLLLLVLPVTCRRVVSSNPLRMLVLTFRLLIKEQPALAHRSNVL